MATLTLFDAIASDSAGARLLVEVAIKGFVLLLGAAVATHLWRGGSAAAKHWIWTVAIGSLLVLPLLATGMPRWHVPDWRPLVQAIAAQPLPDAATVHSAAPAIPSAMTYEDAAPWQDAGSIAGSSISWERSVLIAWATGAAILLGLVLLAHARTAWLVWKAPRLCVDRCDAMVGRLCEEMGIGWIPVLVEGTARTMPMTCGALRPTIILPDGAAERWSHARLEAVLVHELAHIRRRDILVQLLAQAACALHWFNPLAWHALRRIRLEAERACDDVVLGEGVKPSDYAELLLGLARSQRSAAASALAGSSMAESSQLPIRLRSLLDDAQRRGRASLGLLMGMLLAAAATAGAVGAASTGPREAEKSAERLPGGFAGSDRGEFSGLTLGSFARTAADTTQPALLNAEEVYAFLQQSYPSALRDAGVSGTALLELHIEATGQVSNVRVVNATDPAFGEAARTGLLTARFAPALAESGPIAVRLLWPVAFNALSGVETELQRYGTGGFAEVEAARAEMAERQWAERRLAERRLAEREWQVEAERALATELQAAREQEEESLRAVRRDIAVQLEAVREQRAAAERQAAEANAPELRDEQRAAVAELRAVESELAEQLRAIEEQRLAIARMVPPRTAAEAAEQRARVREARELMEAAAEPRAGAPRRAVPAESPGALREGAVAERVATARIRELEREMEARAAALERRGTRGVSPEEAEAITELREEIARVRAAAVRTSPPRPVQSGEPARPVPVERPPLPPPAPAERPIAAPAPGVPLPVEELPEPPAPREQAASAPSVPPVPVSTERMESALNEHHPSVGPAGLPEGRFVWFIASESGEVLHTGIGDQLQPGQVRWEEIQSLLSARSIDREVRAVQHARLRSGSGQPVTVVWIRVSPPSI